MRVLGESWEGSWETVSWALIFGHFVFPMFYLMSRTVKRNRKALAFGALWMLAMHMSDMYWLTQPNLAASLGTHGATFSVLDVTSFIGIGGVALGAFWAVLVRFPLVPVKDPRLSESIAFENF